MIETEFKGTAGPWVKGPNNYKVTVQESGEQIIDATPVNHMKFHLKEMAANAQLCAASPRVLHALEVLVFLHGCEQEGMSSGQPTREEWLEAVNEGAAAIEEALNINING